MGSIVKCETAERYTEFLRAAICDKLGEDRDALKTISARVYVPTDEQRAILKTNGMGNLLQITGSLALDNSNQNVRAFNELIEEGLSAEQDKEVAESLAHQCFICVTHMKRDRRKGHGVMRVH